MSNEPLVGRYAVQVEGARPMPEMGSVLFRVAVTPGEWLQVAIVWEGQERRLYLGGKLIADAMIDNVIVVDRAVSEEQVKRIHLSGSPAFAPTRVFEWRATTVQGGESTLT